MTSVRGAVPVQEPAADTWPALKVDDWAPTGDTLHKWTQIVGKIRMAHQPLVNHLAGTAVCDRPRPDYVDDHARHRCVRHRIRLP